MIPNPEDTIVALASAPGPGARGIVRLSGPAVASVVGPILVDTNRPLPRHTLLRLPGLHSPVPADVYFGQSPRTYTGQDTIEIHLVSCPPLIDALIAALLNAGARAAQPGEFTLRAFLNGKKDLPRAEAVAAIIEAGTPDELTQAMAQLAGGVTQPLRGLRDDLLNLLADIEAGLDFTDEDIQFAAKPDILLRIGKGLAQLMNLARQLESRSVSGKPFRVALIGEPNAGKSSLFNALAGMPAAIVSDIPGTTRDYVSRTVQLADLSIELIDTAGWQESMTTIEEQAQALGRATARSADLLLWCVEAGNSAPEYREELAGLPVVRVVTKCDLDINARAGNSIATSAKSGEGIAQLKDYLVERARTMNRSALAPSLSRCRHHVDSALDHLRAVHKIALFDDPAELLAFELRLALEQIGEMVGAVYTDDLLDRIFSRFCIGK